MSLYNKMSVGFGSGFGVAPSKLFNLKPTDGTGDFSVIRADADAPELITNGDFASGASWTTGTGWSISSGMAASNGSIGSLTQTGLSITSNEQYYVIIETSSGNYDFGGLKIRLGGNTDLASITEDGTHTFILTAEAINTDFGLYVVNTNGFNGFVDNISVKSQSFEYAATRINEDGYIEGVRPNVPRSNFPVGGSYIGCPSLLIEKESENLLKSSEEFNDAFWIKLFGSSVDSDVESSPSDSLTADEFLAGNAANGGIIRGNIVFDFVSNYTLSIYVKKVNYRYVGLRLGNLTGGSGINFFDFDTETIDNSNVPGSPMSFEKSINGWYRLSVTGIPTAATLFDITLTSSSGSQSWTPSGTEKVLLWGASIEKSSFSTSYIPTTTTSTKTREADQINDATITAINEGVLYMNVFAKRDGATDREISFSDGTTANRATIKFDSTSNSITASFINGNISQADLFYFIPGTPDFTKIAFKFKSSDFELWVNGVEVANDTSGTVPLGVLDDLSFDDGGGTNDFYGQCKEIIVFNDVLSDEELTYLTT